ncbi:DUF3993 domain-containing protein [Bacillus sp. ISL-4]|uniref:DUF3993 domain-containing protein n=1 Tax=unclassified Bacillus (in: firmicutes) TaxID=185979 RepID=UPI0015EEE34A|nr:MULTISPECIES: DUF3993 domain-containing protein [unclassified Bacillus (in: firmicutes)]MBT2665989.1 DUF3993 domain-containing protein [Bacillus sp. ISL-4]MBT2670027.1 DUF3993 domain-containing protein [Streptomyces sp. ISL-14]
MRKYLVACLASVLLFLSGGFTASAEGLHREEVLSLVQDAMENQGSISEEVRTKEAIEGKLDKHFTGDFIKKFVQANVVKVDGGYTAFGSDFAPYYIPFFSYDKNTEIVYGKNGDVIYVQEEFQDTGDGPVSMEKHVESVTLKKENGVWKVMDVKYESDKMK